MTDSDKKLVCEGLYETLINLSLDGIFIENERGEILDCNKSGHEMFGYTKEEMLTKSIRDLVPEEFANELPDIISDDMATGDIYVERVNKKKNGQIFPTEINTKYVHINGQKLLIAFVRDITDKKRMEKNLKDMSIKDDLTKVFNRRFILNRFKCEVDKVKNLEDYNFSVALFDLDDFKIINDTYGHIFGDEVLRHVAKTGEVEIGSEEYIGRYGGEEFILIFPGRDHLRSCETVKRIKRKIGDLQFEHPVKVTFSAGVLEVTPTLVKDCSQEEILNMVDNMMYKAKQQGKDTVIFSNSEELQV